MWIPDHGVAILPTSYVYNAVPEAITDTHMLLSKIGQRNIDKAVVSNFIGTYIHALAVISVIRIQRQYSLL